MPKNVNAKKAVETVDNTNDGLYLISNAALKAGRLLCIEESNTNPYPFDNTNGGLYIEVQDMANQSLAHNMEIFKVYSSGDFTLTAEEVKAFEQDAFLTPDEIEEFGLVRGSAVNVIKIMYYTMLKSCATLERILAARDNFEDEATLDRYTALLSVWDSVRIRYNDKMRKYNELVDETREAEIEARLSVPSSFRYDSAEVGSAYARELRKLGVVFPTSGSLQDDVNRRHKPIAAKNEYDAAKASEKERVLHNYWEGIYANGGSVIVGKKRYDNVKIGDLIPFEEGEKATEAGDVEEGNYYRIKTLDFVGGALAHVRDVLFPGLTQARVAILLAEAIRKREPNSIENAGKKGFSISYVSAVERGQIRPSVPVFQAFLDIYDVPVDALLPI